MTSALEDALNARIAELEAARRWIPVSERLPEEGEEVVVVRDGHPLDALARTAGGGVVEERVKG